MLDLDAVRLVKQEMEQDAVQPLSSSVRESSNVEAATYPIDAGRPAPLAGSLEERVVQLENLVFTLRKTVQRERALLRKAILLHLDMDEIYREPVDES